MINTKSFLTVDGEKESELIIQKSRFIGYAKHVDNSEEAKEFVAKIKKRHFDATHNCYAYVCGTQSEEKKFSDDGEPQGTAGMPILDVLTKRSLTQAVVVVTRYFGGIKLGAGGLVRAYSQAASQVLDEMAVSKNEFAKFFRLQIEYSLLSKIEKQLLKLPLEIVGKHFDNNVDILFVVNEQKCDDVVSKICDLTLGKAILKEEKQDYYKFKI